MVNIAGQLFNLYDMVLITWINDDNNQLMSHGELVAFDAEYVYVVEDVVSAKMFNVLATEEAKPLRTAIRLDSVIEAMEMPKMGL